MRQSHDNLTGKMAHLPCLMQQTWFAMLLSLSSARTVFSPALGEEGREERRREKDEGERR